MSGKDSLLRVKAEGGETFLLLSFLPTGGFLLLLTASQLATSLTDCFECDTRPSFFPNDFSTKIFYLARSCQDGVWPLSAHYGGFVLAPVTAVGSDHVRQSHCGDAQLVSGGCGQSVGTDGASCTGGRMWEKTARLCETTCRSIMPRVTPSSSLSG